jgi:hypothetical protein
MIPNPHGHQQQPKAVANLISHGAIEGTDWRIGDSPIDWHGRPCVIEFGPVIGVNNGIRPAGPHALPVLIRRGVPRGDALRPGALRAGRELTGGRP